MTQLPKILETSTKVRFQDCDPFNHLNNASYINYFMNHREDALIDNYDIDIYKMAKTIGKSWVSSKTQIAYLKPAFLNESVVLESQLIQYGDTELIVEMRMLNENKTQLKAIVWCSFVHFNLIEQKRDNHSKELMSLFNSVRKTVEAKAFDERLNQLKTNTLSKNQAKL